MSIERELFEKEYCKAQMITDKGDTFEQLPNGDYIRHSLQLAWLMWQASANRQGYKLVPVVDSDAMWSAGRVIIEENGYSADASDIYKAMIGACDAE